MSAVPEQFFSLQPVESRSRKSGRAVQSDRGDSVWEWQTSTGVFERNVTDEQLRRLEATDLQIVEFSPPSETVWTRDVSRTATVLDRVSRRVPQSRQPAPATGALRSLWSKLRGL